MCHFRECDKEARVCNAGIFYVFLGCGHSYHPECIAPKLDTCPICLDILKVAVSTLSAKANNSIFNPNGNVAQDQDEDEVEDYMGDKIPSQGQIVDLSAIHSQMTDAEIKKIFEKKTCQGLFITRAKRIMSEVFYLNHGFLEATTFNQKVAGRHLTLLLSTINEA